MKSPSIRRGAGDREGECGGGARSAASFVSRGGLSLLSPRRGAREARVGLPVYRAVHFFRGRPGRTRVSRRWEEWKINNRNRPYRLSRARGNGALLLPFHPTTGDPAPL